VTVPRICPVIATWARMKEELIPTMNRNSTIFFAMTSPYLKTVMR
jgi:hypothetical protein